VALAGESSSSDLPLRESPCTRSPRSVHVSPCNIIYIMSGRVWCTFVRIHTHTHTHTCTPFESQMNNLHRRREREKEEIATKPVGLMCMHITKVRINCWRSSWVPPECVLNALLQVSFRTSFRIFQVYFYTTTIGLDRERKKQKRSEIDDE